MSSQGLCRRWTERTPPARCRHQSDAFGDESDRHEVLEATLGHEPKPDMAERELEDRDKIKGARIDAELRERPRDR